MEASATRFLQYQLRCRNISSSFAAEAIACLQVVNIGRELGLTHVIIKGDSLTAIKKIQNQNRDRSKIGPFIFDIKERRTMFFQCQFQHVKRTENAEAHNLASEGLKMDRQRDANHGHATTSLIGAGNDTSKNGQVDTEAKVDRGWKRHL